MAELAAGLGGDGSDGEPPGEEGYSDPPDAFDGESVPPTILTRDGTVSLPAHWVALYDSLRSVGYKRSLRDFVIEWMTIGFAVSGMDVRLMPISDIDRERILSALGVSMEMVTV